MRSAFVHEARLELSDGADHGAPGAAITVALCGHWEHEGSCRWPHHTAVQTQDDTRITVRTVFASDPSDEAVVRAGIGGALRGGHLDGPTGSSDWRVLSDGPAEPGPEESMQASRWISQGQG